jgi:hypothetical protein
MGGVIGLVWFSFCCSGDRLFRLRRFRCGDFGDDVVACRFFVILVDIVVLLELFAVLFAAVFVSGLACVGRSSRHVFLSVENSCLLLISV